MRQLRQSVFRYHHTPPSRVTSPLFRQLITEWIDLNSSTAASSSIERWGSLEPQLVGFTHPYEIVDVIDAADPTDQDALMLALLRLTQAGQALAGRILLQLMLHKLGRISLRIVPCDTDTAWDEDRKQLVIAEFWDTICTYPVERRTRAVAANLALDTLHRCTQHRPWRDKEIPTSHGNPDFDAAALSAQLGVTSDDHTDQLRLADVVQWAATRNVITDAEGALLMSIYADEESPQDAAERLNVTPAVIRQRCSRARRRLQAALKDKSARLAS